MEGDRVSKDERGEAPWFAIEEEDNEAAVGGLNESNESSSTSADEDNENVSS